MMLKMCKGAILALVLALLGLTISTAEVSAEQAAAEQYRQMFRSGNFYVEYETYDFFRGTWGSEHRMKYNHVLAGKNGNRVVKTKLNEKVPAVLYQDGKYYSFYRHTKQDVIGFVPTSNTSFTALVLPKEELHSPNLNPDEDWDKMRHYLALPDELAVFYWNDPFRDNEVNIEAPHFNGSSTRTVDKKDYDCDQYTIDIKSTAGTTLAQWAYNMLYENGKLVRIQKYFLRDGQESLIEELNIKTLTDQVPDTAFTIKKKFKVYAADTGTMSDLIEQPALVEEIGGKK